MFSKEWKIATLALISLIMVTGCQKSKKKAPGNSYAGIWVLQDNVATHNKWGSSAEYCARFREQPIRYVDPHNNYTPRAIYIAGNGEVFRYEINQPTISADTRARYFLGTVNPAGYFQAGTIAADGRIQPATSWGNYAASPFDLPLQTSFIMRGTTLVIVSQGETLVYQRSNAALIQTYMLDTMGCVKTCKRYGCSFRVEHYSGGGGYYEGGPQGGPEFSAPPPWKEKDAEKRRRAAATRRPAPQHLEDRRLPQQGPQQMDPEMQEDFQGPQ